MSRVPLVEGVDFRFADKVLHACAYGFLALLALAGTWFWARRFSWAFILATARGVIDEIHQSFVPGRSATAGDCVADAFGALCMIFFVWLLWRAFFEKDTASLPIEL